MVSVAFVVEKLVQERPFVQEALGEGIINNAALAERLRPEVEKMLRKKVKFSAVNMAVRRLREKLEGAPINMVKFEKNADITVKSDLVQITVHKSEDIQEYFQKLYNVVDYSKGDFLTVTQGVYEVMIITNARHEKKLLSMLPQKMVKKVIRDVCSLTIKVPENATELVGFFYLITRAFTQENIPIVDLVSTYTENTLTVKEQVLTRAFTALQRVLKENS